ncbi:MAG: energy transducer TonB [Chitinophagaceae bacterium]|nr:energy transducer TonB [Chitinophagaceae bacterium]
MNTVINTKKRTNAILATAFLLLFYVSCREEEKKVDSATVVTTSTDSTTVTSPDSSSSTSVTTTTSTSTSTNNGSGKPNPAKKGRKGKAIIVINSSSAGTNTAMEADKEGIYNRADVMPSFPGGEKALIKFLEDNIQYPQAAIDEGVEGSIKVSFAVDEAGKVYTPMIKSEKMGYGLEEEAMRVISKMPKWNPGSIKGKNVKTRFEVPITYVIN